MNISTTLTSAIFTVWQAIAPDCIEVLTDNEEAIEICTDGDRLLPYMGFIETPHAWTEYRALCLVHGYRKVIEALAEDPRLQLI